MPTQATQTKPTKHNKPKRNRQKRDRNLTPFSYQPPVSRRVRLTFAESFAMVEGAAGNGIERIFRLNGAYDVDTTLGSTSTAGFAEYAAFFSNYRVWKTAVRAEGTVSGGSSGSIATVILYPNAVNTFLGTPNSWLMAPGSIKKVVRSDNTGGGNLFRLERKFDLPSIARITPAQYKADMDYSAITNTTPARQMYFALAVQGQGSSSVVTATIVVYVQMDIEFFNPIMLAS